MSHENEIILTIVGPESAMKEIEKISMAGVEIDPPQPLDAMVDAVDAPLGPDEIQLFLMHATVVLKFGAAAAQFGLVAAKLAGELKHLLTRTEPHEKPRIVASLEIGGEAMLEGIAYHMQIGKAHRVFGADDARLAVVRDAFGFLLVV